MPAYQIFCTTKDCKHPALYKIAAQWSDGIVRELKTYALCCEACLPATLSQARAKQKACRLTSGESLLPPGVYRLHRGQRDQALERLPELEHQLGGHAHD